MVDFRQFHALLRLYRWRGSRCNLVFFVTSVLLRVCLRVVLLQSLEVSPQQFIEIAMFDAVLLPRIDWFVVLQCRVGLWSCPGVHV